MHRGRKEELENQLNRSAIWAVTYGDLMSYLMIFFLILFSFSIGKGRPVKESRKYEESLASIQKVFGGKTDPKALGRSKQKQMEQEAAENISESLKKSPLAKYVEVKTTEEKVQLVLKEPILFDSGKAELKPVALPVLREIAQEIKALPNEIRIEGHTDGVPVKKGPFDSNWALSMARAYAVIQFFESEGIDSKRLSGSGYGEHRPAAQNDTAEGRAKNRRISIELIRNQ